MEPNSLSIFTKTLDAGLGVVAVCIFGYVLNMILKSHSTERNEWRTCIENNTKAFQQFEATIKLLLATALHSAVQQNQSPTRTEQQKNTTKPTEH